jgi:hypothetical protein
MSEKFFEKKVPIGDSLEHKVVAFKSEQRPIKGSHKRYNSEIIVNRKVIVQGYFEVAQDQEQLTNEISTPPRFNLTAEVKSKNNGLNPIPRGYTLFVVRYDNPYLEPLARIDLWKVVQKTEPFNLHKKQIDTDRLQLWAGKNSIFDIYDPRKRSDFWFSCRKLDQRIRRLRARIMKNEKSYTNYTEELIEQGGMQRELGRLRQQAIAENN